VDLFDVIALSEEVGVAKPDPGIFEYALGEAGVPAARAVHVGNRLDTDVRAARRVGLRAVWVLRGEAPPRPTPEQLAEADVAIASLAELPAAVAGLAGEGAG
jgi:FMN phosphatase YigB (HAD superfamily)